MKKMCPCNSKKEYDECCKPFHERSKICKNSKELLISRYSAYALGISSYIINTTFEKSKKDPVEWANEVNNFSKQYEFRGVKIYEIKEMQNFATIRFKAILKKGNKDASFQETSLFIKDHGLWYYQKSL